MPVNELVLRDFSGGEVDDSLFGRSDLRLYRNSCKRLVNFLADWTGQARYRPGFKFVHHTRLNRFAVLVGFEYNDEQAYALEFTDKKLRFYKDNSLITEDPKNITGVITNANPAVVNLTSHGFANGDEVFIESASNISQVNGRSFIVSGAAANTFQLFDVDGNAIDSTSFGSHVSGTGTVKRVYEIDTPYAEANDLRRIRVDQDADLLYLVHPYYEPRKLTRTSHTAWTLSLYTRTNDPFLAKKPVTGVTNANPGVVTSVGHGLTAGTVAIIEAVGGTVEINSSPYLVGSPTANTFELLDLNGNPVDTTSFGVYTTGGYVSAQSLLPEAITFYESRLWMAGPAAEPAQFVGSRSPTLQGVARYDDFTSGTNADDAVYYVIADSEVNKILWLEGVNRNLVAGTFGSVVRIFGDSVDQPVTPTSVNTRAVEKIGVDNLPPVNRRNNALVYIQRAGNAAISLGFDLLNDSFIPEDRTLVSRHVARQPFLQMAWQVGRPDVIWCVNALGELRGLTFHKDESIYAWHQHRTAAGDIFESVLSLPRSKNTEQLWAVVSRKVGGVTRRYVEYLSDEWVPPNQEDFYTGDVSKDGPRFTRALVESQKSYTHLDSFLSYDGTVNAASVTPSAVSGSSVPFNTSGAVFEASDVGREIRVKSVDGSRHGRAVIDIYTSATSVVCTVLEDFDSTSVIPAGQWYLTTAAVTNLDHLIGRVVGLVADGAEHPERTVDATGSVALEKQASVIHVGLKYLGYIATTPLEFSFDGQPGSGAKNVSKIGARLLNTLGCKMGTNLYRLEPLPFTTSPLAINTPQAPFSGVVTVPNSDSWAKNKTAFLLKDSPTPCTVQGLYIHGETVEE